MIGRGQGLNVLVRQGDVVAVGHGVPLIGHG
jgi:hypothetical protein